MKETAVTGEGALAASPDRTKSLLSSTEVPEEFGSGLGLPAIWNRKFQIKAVLSADIEGHC